MKGGDFFGLKEGRES
jgi:hypothetical protein